MSLADDINALADADSTEALWYRHCRTMERYGFTRLLYGFTHYRAGTSLGDPEDFVVLSNHAPEYLEWFIGQERYKHAPMVDWALNNNGVMSWSSIWDNQAKGLFTAAQNEIVEFNRAYGLTAGYTISFNSVSPRSKGAIALAAAPDIDQASLDRMWSERGAEVIALNNMAHLKAMSLPHVSAARSLTDRQREVLHWIGDGKTIADTALVMGLTGATVEKHLRLAREALGVETTAQAVLKAALQKQIFVVEYMR